ncbi:hypothetical protein FWK35_00009448 [Aphis craccivora]|uniref:Uncharacterized protein n=1 Tax=Aphis craccivora TaxID=307492 RepID=A0A6G0YQ64_APHCR|nr:hypothetical protein FWK35_00009448 [Aphis craccivora]
MQLHQINTGIRSSNKKKKYNDSAVKLKNIVDDYYNILTLQYLKGIAYNFSLQV